MSHAGQLSLAIALWIA